MRPVLAGHVRLRELDDGTYTLADIQLLNDAMDVHAENERRIEAALKG